MQYRQNKRGEDISVLGFGCMRFAHKGAGIDIDEAERQILKALELGVNYFDTAYIYPGNEVAIGEVIKRNPDIRKKMNIATKLPQYMVKSIEDVERIFNEELGRLNIEYIDYYLMHMLTDVNSFERLHNMGIEKWIEDKKAEGKIRYAGFSFHGNSDMFIRILDKYDWDFCQIQYNYIDEHTQAGRKGLMAAAEKNIPVIIMEPLRGGKLINMLPKEALEIMKKSGREYTPAEWGLRWLWNQKEVTCVLSGMNTLDMVEENCRIASAATANSMTEEDSMVINKIKGIWESKMKVPCTACRYCMPCPKGVDIPGVFSCYNHVYTEGKAEGRHEFFQTVALRKEPALPSQCVECGKCESHCPQAIKIREELKKADKELNPWYYKIAFKIARKYMFRKEKSK